MTLAWKYYNLSLLNHEHILIRLSISITASTKEHQHTSGDKGINANVAGE